MTTTTTTREAATPTKATRTRARRITARRWATAWLVVLLAASALVVHVAHAQEQAPDDAAASVATTPAASDGEQRVVVSPGAKVPDFVPTNEWQDILPGQSVPPGLHVRLNLATGKREAKLLSEEDAALDAPHDATGAERTVEMAVGAAADPTSVTVVTDANGEIAAATTHGAPSHVLTVVEDSVDEDDEQPAPPPAADNADASASDAIASGEEELDETPPAREPNWNHDKIYEVLHALPEPPDVDGMDIHEARAKLSQPEFRRQMIKLWKKRQEELKEALNSLQDDAKYLANLLDDFREADKNGDTKGQLRLLEVLEWEAQDLDKTQVFNFIGGFGVMTDYLNSTNLPVRASVSWLIGTAVKNYKDGQDWAINAGAVPRLVDSLTLPVPVDDADSAAAVFEVKKKAVYALSSLARFNARAQRLFLSLDGPSKLSRLMDEHHPLGVQLKTVLFVHDLLYEESAQAPTSADDEALGQLHEIFQSPVWCAHTARFFQDNAAKLQRNQQAETVQAMLAQLPACKNDFATANVKLTIEGVVAKWQADESLDADERQDLSMVGNAILAEL